MNGAAVRVGVGTRFLYDGDVAEVVEMLSTTAGNEVVLKDAAGQRLARVSMRDLLDLPAFVRLNVRGRPPAYFGYSESNPSALTLCRTTRTRSSLVNATSAILATGILCADSSPICAPRQVTTTRCPAARSATTDDPRIHRSPEPGTAQPPSKSDTSAPPAGLTTPTGQTLPATALGWARRLW